MIAFLIAAHNQPLIVRRLVLALSEPWARFFIHIDRKADIKPFQEALGDLSQVTFVQKRIDVYWGGWSIVQATLDLMQTALDTKEPFRRFVLLSGGCYPVKNNLALRNFLFAAPSEYINAVRVPNVEFDKPLTRFTCWHFEGGYRTPGMKALGIKLVNKITAWLPVRDVQKGLEGLQPYAGSQWWCLSCEAVVYILDFVRKNPRIMAFFRHVAYPDEAFFQTVLMNSDFADRVRQSLTYTDWSDPNERPCTIGARHLPQLFGMQAADGTPIFFARKFSPKNAEVADRIDAIRNQAASG